MKIQNYRNSEIFENYESAINFINNTLTNDTSIVDGEEVFVRYYQDGAVVSIVAIAYVDINGNVSFSLVNDEGVGKIITSPTPPGEKYQDGYLWLEETDDGALVDDNITCDIRSMQRAIAELYSIVDRFKYAFENEMNCGTVSENSTRMKLMSEAEPEIPMGYEDGTDAFLLSSYEEGAIDSIKIYYRKSSNGESESLYNSWSENVEILDEVNSFLWVYLEVTYISEKVKSTSPYLLCSYKEGKVIEDILLYFKLGGDESVAPDKTEVRYSLTRMNATEELPFLYCYVECKYAKDENENKPRYYENSTPNVKHLIIKSAQTEAEIKENILNICDNELVWCEGNNGLYIRSNGQLVKINGYVGNNNNDNNNNDNNFNDIMNGIITNGDYIGTIDFVSSSNKVYRMKVTDDKGLQIYNKNLDTPYPSDKYTGSDNYESKLFLEDSTKLSKVYINSFYCSGDDNNINEHSIKPCSHNFVELSNLTESDLNLNGFTLQYSTNGTTWKVLPLWGIIPAKGTFLIRGAQCSILDSNVTVIKVKEYDMEWYEDTNKLIKFNSQNAIFYLTYGTKTPPKNPFNFKDDVGTAINGFVDLVGVGGAVYYEKKVYSNFSSDYLMKKYYAMDDVKQANKEINKRDNSKDWCYINLKRNDILPVDVASYTPRASYENKRFKYDKSIIHSTKPITLSVSFGIQATDNSTNGGSGATRCFNWVSKGYYDEFLWIKKLSDGEDASTLTIDDVNSGWERIESHCGKDNELISANGGEYGYVNMESGRKFYHRIQRETTEKELCTTHKVIKRKLKTGVYAYVCGKSTSTGMPLKDGCTDIRTFKVRSYDDVVQNGFSFVHTSDQQGFNWDEYQVWKYSAEKIKSTYGDSLDFVINTGDATQNGNRTSEWIDYFNGRTPLNDFVEMYTIGNNDLCPRNVYEKGNGEDTTKINPDNIKFYYTFELNEDNLPLFNVGGEEVYIPSLYSFNYGSAHFLCVNSEICYESILYGLDKNGLLYPYVKEWCEKDLELVDNSMWKIAYCHEMPFTIITSVKIKEYSQFSGGTFVLNNKVTREGSRINTNLEKLEDSYWFGKFCQENDIRLVMGGHKHTQAITWPLKENFQPTLSNGTYSSDDNRSMQPTIQLTKDELSAFDGSTELVTYEGDTYQYIKGNDYPNAWFSSPNTFKDNDCVIMAHCCKFEMVSDSTQITAPIYSMSQATGYKHTSNKELPAPKIPWIRHYFPATGGKANSNQKMPFFTIIDVNEDTIVLTVKRITGIMNGGNFNINQEGENVKNGNAKVELENGISENSAGSTTTVVIKKNGN